MTFKRIFAYVLLMMMVPTIAHAEYFVQKGDTMSGIAKKNGMLYSSLKSLNPQIPNLNRIYPGQYVNIRKEGQEIKDLTDYARSLQESTHYVYGGTSPLATDCSGWVQNIFGKFGVKLPRVSRDQARIGKTIPFKDIQAGDLMYFSTVADKHITHVGIYLGQNFWISNLNTDKDVQILSTFGSWTQRYFMWAKRVL